MGTEIREMTAETTGPIMYFKKKSGIEFAFILLHNQE
jgi:hypothetical protein